MNIEIGSYQAKTRLPELLRGVQAGQRYTITLRGRAVADLVPPAKGGTTDAVAAVEEMLAFAKARRHDVDIDLKSIIEEGRT